MCAFTDRRSQRRLLAAVLLAWCAGAWAGWKVPREALDQRLASVDFLIHYTLAGEHAFAPDLPAGKAREAAAAARLQALAAQLERADRFYRDALGLRPPLAGPRYAGGRGIDVHLIALPGKSGSTGDELQHFDYRYFPARPAVLSIAISSRWRPTSLTPAHELFHAYQYGYTHFKNPWFLEGMARASEQFFRPQPRQETPLPRDRGALDALLEKSYAAATLWNRLIDICGAGFLRPLLETLDREDDRAARDYGIQAGAWPEAAQRSAANNAYLLRGLRATLAEPHCPAVSPDSEIRRFNLLLDAWLAEETGR